MSGGIAHEINNPLAIISGKTQLLLKGLSKIEGMAEVEKLKSYLHDIKRTTDRIASIIKGLKNFARDSAKDSFLSTSVSQIIEETLAFCEARFASQSIEVRKINTTTALMIECRAAQISQVLLNTLNNSYDAIEKIPNPWIEIEVTELESSIKIVITDCGSGIPKEVRDKLMNPFFTTKDVGKGTGLGLSLSRGIIESHHGKFGFDFEYKNTRIVIELPKTQSVSHS
jgi:C4-dicarboxylate-specific signal transduction histidine kinase